MRPPRHANTGSGYSFPANAVIARGGGETALRRRFLETLSEAKAFGGVQAVYVHDSAVCQCAMRFGVYLPPQVAGDAALPVLYWLSGLTCTEENFITKAGAQRLAAELGLIIVAPDTSPRGEGAPDDPEGAYDLGLGAGFYLDADKEPWRAHYNMYSYVSEELPSLIEKEFPVNPARAGVFGHSMGGHGALILHLKNPQKFKSCTAFAPIVAPSQVPWGRKAFAAYLGEEQKAWLKYDATALLTEQGPTTAHLLIDQGDADGFLEKQLRPALFQAAAQQAGQALTLRFQKGYDHSYYFIASFIDDHLRWHHRQLMGA